MDCSTSLHDFSLFLFLLAAWYLKEHRVIHPSDHPILGMKWRRLYYYDRCMPMGCSNSCKTFKIFSTSIEWIARHKLEIDELLHLLDDFLFVSATYSQCQGNLDRFIYLCSQLGIPIAPDKTFVRPPLLHLRASSLTRLALKLVYHAENCLMRRIYFSF